MRAMDSRPKIDFIDGRLQGFSLYLPLLFFALMPLQGTRFFMRYAVSVKPMLIMMAEFLFLNLVHTAMGYSIIIALPEGRQWRQDQQSSLFAGFSASVAIVSAILAVFFMTTFHLMPAPAWAQEFCRYAVKLVIPVLFTHHGLSQVRGIGLIYNQFIRKNFALSQEELQMMRRIENREKITYDFMIVMSSAALALWGRGWNQISDAAVHAQYGLSFASLAAGVYIYWLNLRLPHVSATNKPLFLLRLGLSAAMGFNFLAYIGRLCTHGIEYLQIFRKITANSVQGRPRELLAVMTPLAVAVGLAYCIGYTYYHEIEISSGVGVPLWARLAFVVYLVQTPIHYYCDRLMFRMRDPAAHLIMALITGGSGRRHPARAAEQSPAIR